MKQKLSLAALLLFANFVCSAQNSNAQFVANKIAQKMKDSLLLTDYQKDQAYQINLQLNDQKMSIRQQFQRRDSIAVKIQRIENTRDSLYHTFLPDDKFVLYKVKKENLINNN